MVFLLYCWSKGLIDKSKVNHLTSEVHSIINTVESEIKSVMQHQRGGDNKDANIQQRVDGSDVHIVFSTDCSEYQDWQTLLLFHSAKVVGQKGRITRIASGCTDEKQQQLTELYQRLYPEFGAHFTPDFKKDAKTKKSYDFYNKPWGMKHWLEYCKPPLPEDTYIALLDPDMILLRPLTRSISEDPAAIFDREYYAKEGPLPLMVSKGHAVAQMYGLGAPWTNDNHKKFRRGKICGEGSPCLLTQLRFGEMHYSVGPPYFLHKTDMHAVVDTWTEFVPRVYEDYPYLLAEMYAYSMAAAHEKLPHLQVEHYMVSNVDATGEGWPHVDAQPVVCVPPDEKGIFYPGQNMPTVAHFCQGYVADDIGWYKRRMPKNIFSCDSPMLVNPPVNITVHEPTKNDRQSQNKFRRDKRNAFMACVAYSTMNAALIDYKQRMCDGHPKVNYKREINMHKG